MIGYFLFGRERSTFRGMQTANDNKMRALATQRDNITAEKTQMKKALLERQQTILSLEQAQIKVSNTKIIHLIDSGVTACSILKPYKT